MTLGVVTWVEGPRWLSGRIETDLERLLLTLGVVTRVEGPRWLSGRIETDLERIETDLEMMLMAA